MLVDPAFQVRVLRAGSPSARPRALLAAATLTAMALAMPAAHAQLLDSVGGRWSPIYDYSAQIGCAGVCSDRSDLSAGALLPVGLQRGKVLFWRESCNGCDTLNRTTEAYLFDPADPDDLVRVVHPVLDTDLFCAGFSWDHEGKLLVTGGVGTGVQGGPAVWTYHFYPTLLGPIVTNIYNGARSVSGPDAWMRAGDLAITEGSQGLPGRYYPSVCPLNRRPLAGTPVFAGGGHLVLGGSPDPADPGDPGENCTDPGYHSNWNHGTAVWQHFDPTQTAWDTRLLYPSGQIPPSGPVSVAYDRRDLNGTLVTNLAANPIPALETYPRAFQLADHGSGTEQHIFIAYDVPAFANQWILYNPLGAAWVVKPAFGTQGWELQEATSGFERFYGNALLFHTLQARNRVVVIGGAKNISTAPNPEDAPVWAMVQEVQEYIIPLGATSASGTWRTKSIGPSRTNASSVILPTGQVLLLGGGAGVDACDAGPHSPAYAPLIYDIGPLPDAAGWTVAVMNLSNLNAQGQRVPRLYHSMATLLEDGRVLHAAGETYSSPFGNSGKTGEVFSPPYLFQGPRPTIASAPSEAAFNVSGGTNSVGITINHSYPIDRIVLLRPAAVTHSFDIDQRYIEMSFTIQSGSSGTHRSSVTLPTEDLGPPGWYMMFAVQNGPQGRVPSVAWWIHIT